ncbi:MAG TPA: GH3 auxin-responsive promoter family protein, partial [Firmicutes bacterium]|nr:GH3 auxin-responsive promoter family protein [Bacillota bacterium]
MPNLVTLLREGRTAEAWTKYCGVIDLTLDEFMQVQERLLAEQLQLLSASVLGRKLLGGATPRSVADFRRGVPLTVYEDYLPYLAEKREDVLPAKPQYWVCTSGKAGSYDRKWAPYPVAWFQTHTKNFLAAIIFSLCTKKGDFSLPENAKFLYAMAPPPYLTGMVPYGLKSEFPFCYLPPSAQAERMGFEEQNQEGFRLGLSRGVDLFFGLSSVLVRVGERFAAGGTAVLGGGKPSPRAVLRLARGYAASRLKRRELLPKDVWHLKGIICAGTDTTFYKERIEYYWGKKPLEVYGGTEIGIAATQTWDYSGMLLFPDANFWEFIPEEEHEKSLADPAYQPRTVLT